MVLTAGSLTKTTVRLDAVSRLKGKTLAGQRVYSGKATHQKDATDYAINVNTPGGNLGHRSASAYSYKQVIQLVVSAFVAILPDDAAGLQGDEADEELSRRVDQMEEEVLDALFTDPGWRDVWVEPPDVQIAHERTVDGRLRTGAVHLTFSCEDSRRWSRSLSDATTLDTVTVSVEPLGEDGEPIPDLPPIEFEVTTEEDP